MTTTDYFPMLHVTNLSSWKKNNLNVNIQAQASSWIFVTICSNSLIFYCGIYSDVKFE